MAGHVDRPRVSVKRITISLMLAVILFIVGYLFIDGMLNDTRLYMPDSIGYTVETINYTSVIP